MKTDDLITMLANGAEAVEQRAPQRRYTIALGWGGFGAALLMAITLGVRPDFAEAAMLPMFWVKLALPAALLAGGLLAVLRLSRPGVLLGRVPAALVAPVLAIWLLSAVVLLGAVPEARAALIFGETWKSCPFNITLLSMPVFVALIWAMKGLAPTRLVLSGAAAGLLSGAMGATVYALHCPEMAAPFLAIWYLIGMLIPTALGALLGPRLLRW
jgi:hypothetical protein